MGSEMCIRDSFIGGRFVTGMLTDLLQNIGVDDMGQKMGIASIVGNNSIAKMVGNVAFFFILFAGIIAGVDRLGIGSVSNILNDIFGITGKIFFGGLILAVGFWIANTAHDALAKSDPSMATIARIAIMAIFLAFGLSLSLIHI